MPSCDKIHRIIRQASLCLVLFLIISQLLYVINLSKISYELDYISIENLDESKQKGRQPPGIETLDEEEKGRQAPGIDFSVCALVKDENNNLLEWTAYHYYMINMHHLVLCNDLDSVSSPLEVLGKWKDIINIDVWHVDTFSPPIIKDNQTIYRTYVDRQMQCLRSCMEHFKRENRTWTLFIDPDEFLTFNPVAEDDTNCVFDKVSNQTNGSNNTSAFKIVYDGAKWPERCTDTQLMKRTEDSKTISMDLWKRRLMLPTSQGSKTIAEYIQQDKNLYPWANFNCIVLPRLQFGSKQETNEAILKTNIPAGFHAHNFSTLSFFSHGKKGEFARNRWGKCIVDVSRIGIVNIRSPHYMAFGCGGLSKGWAEHDSSLLRVNHYVGGYKAFFNKIDAHRTEKMFNSRSESSSFNSLDMQGWLDGFVRLVGIEKAKELLKSVGEIKDYKTHE